MAPPAPVVSIRTSGEYAKLATWFELTVVVANPLASSGPVHLTGVRSTQEHIAVDDDLLMPREPIGPGETLVLVVRLRPLALEPIELGKLHLAFDELAQDLSGLSTQVLSVKPSLEEQLQPRLEALVPYPDGATKVRLSLSAPSHPSIRVVNIAVSNRERIRAGKAQAVLAPVPAEGWEIEWVVQGDVIELSLSTVLPTTGDEVKEHLRLEVPEPTGRWARPFAFLDAKDLGKHVVSIHTIGRQEAPVDPGYDQVYDVTSGTTVELRIRARTAQSDPKINVDSAGRIRVRPQEARATLPGWVLFHLDLEPTRSVWFERERLQFVVEAGSERSYGEVHLSVGPERGRRWRAALTLGFAFTANALVEIYQLASGPEQAVQTLEDLQELAAADPIRDLEIIGILSVPLIAMGSWFLARVWRRLERR